MNKHPFTMTKDDWSSEDVEWVHPTSIRLEPIPTEQTTFDRIMELRAKGQALRGYERFHGSQYDIDAPAPERCKYWFA